MIFGKGLEMSRVPHFLGQTLSSPNPIGLGHGWALIQLGLGWVGTLYFSMNWAWMGWGFVQLGLGPSTLKESPIHLRCLSHLPFLGVISCVSAFLKFKVSL